ncbi:GNAT family N-acetyltransferase [Balneatrix alpica]|uniref:GNAT family N-acetyltransferase n=1 Tax=Balneatrix alpica TaxID=75684 RepID=A0ABV5ZDE1_9GAMM|nr:GNAT family N-acetyltransferase [Balneatrix alpica]
MSLSLQWLAFSELSASQLYQVLALRQQVFVLEQQCLYPDIDGNDPQALHLLAWQGNELQGYLRVFMQDTPVRIGRVVVAPAGRGQGLAAKLMQAALKRIAQERPATMVELGAQQYLEEFYRRLGFMPVSNVYLEDGIPHIDMRRLSAS